MKMEIKVLQETKTRMEFMMYGEEHTFANLLKDVLYNDNNVKIASYSIDHPLKREIRFYLETKDENPREALKKAAKEIKKITSKLSKEISK